MQLSRKQVKKLRGNFERHNESDIPIGSCRKVAPSVKICRRSRDVYERTTRRRSVGNRPW